VYQARKCGWHVGCTSIVLACLIRPLMHPQPHVSVLRLDALAGLREWGHGDPRVSIKCRCGFARVLTRIKLACGHSRCEPEVQKIPFRTMFFSKNAVLGCFSLFRCAPAGRQARSQHAHRRNKEKSNDQGASFKAQFR
jgi:hypothetical protein